MTYSKMLITAATGNVGTPLVKALHEKKMDFTIATRDAGKAAEKFNFPLHSVYLDFRNPKSFAPALKGQELLFLCGPSATPDAQDLLLPLLQEASKQKIKHVVFIASYPALREYIEKSGMKYTFIRANFFMQNFEIYQTEDIRDKGQILMPTGEGKAPFIHTRDIGEVVTEVMAEPAKYENETLYLTGSESMNHFKVAEIFSDVLGKMITYANPDDITYRMIMQERGMSSSWIDAMIAVFGKIKRGEVSQTTDTVKDVLGREPLSLKQYVEEQKELFTFKKSLEVLVLYFSKTGNTKKLAHHVAEGVNRVNGAKAVLKTTAEVKKDDFLNSYGIIAGSPVYFGTMAAELKKVIDDFVSTRKKMENKVGAAFATAADASGGKETTMFSIIQAFLIYGMVIVGDPLKATGHYGTSCVSQPDEKTRENAIKLGERVANTVIKLHG